MEMNNIGVSIRIAVSLASVKKKQLNYGFQSFQVHFEKFPQEIGFVNQPHNDTTANYKICPSVTTENFHSSVVIQLTLPASASAL
jgi:hypothetical protein